MSVINQMLKDLDKRRVKRHAASDENYAQIKSFSHGHVDEDESRPKWFWLSIVGALLLLMVSVVTWYYWLDIKYEVRHVISNLHFTLHRHQPSPVPIANVNQAIPPPATTDVVSTITNTTNTTLKSDSNPEVAIHKVVVNLSPEQQATQAYQRVLELLDHNDEFDAINALRAILDQAPDFKPARELLAELLYQQRRYDEAGTVLNTGLNLAPGYVPFVELQAHIMHARGDVQGAISLLKSALPSMAKHAEYYGLLAAMEEEVGNADVAASYYNDLVQLNPTNGKWWLGLGVALERMSNTPAAIHAYEKAEMYGDKLKPQSRQFIRDRLSTLESG